MFLDRAGMELGNVLNYLARRQEVVASNIANADTPGYKTRDVESPGEFSAVLQQTASSSREVADLPARNDGNNVGMDREARLLSENTMRFNLATQMIRGELKGIRSAIEEGRSS